jgi:hypothetical protein
MVQKMVLRIMLGTGPRYSCKGWFVKLNILPVLNLYIFSLIMFVFSNLGNFKTNAPLHDFNTRCKNHLQFPSVKLTSVKKHVTYSAIKMLNHLLLSMSELQENKTLFKSALRKYRLIYFFCGKSFSR